MRVVHCKKEKFDHYLGRPFVFGNPFSHKEGALAIFKVDTVEEAVAKYREWILNQPELIIRVKRELKRKVIGCWCKVKGNEPCHGDVLLEIANE